MGNLPKSEARLLESETRMNFLAPGAAHRSIVQCGNVQIPTKPTMRPGVEVPLDGDETKSEDYS